MRQKKGFEVKAGEYLNFSYKPLVALPSAAEE
jgi:hypothetical protein